MVTIKQIKEMANEIKKANGYKYIGIRVQDNSYNAKVGSIIEHRSNVWEDGEMMTEKLNGVCAVKIQNYRINRIDNYSGYEGDTVLILGSNSVTKGYDEDEIIMSKPVVLEIRRF